MFLYNFKEVDFNTYCPKCQNRNKKDVDDPCNECLTVSARQGTRRPINYEGIIFVKPKKASNH